MRAFNRYYTNLIGVLDKGYLETQYSLTEARILFEISLGKKNASEIIDAMRIDKSYLSRVLNKFEKNKLIIKSKSEKDSRASRICLTDKGMRDLNALNELADQQLDALLKNLSATESKQLALHMNSIIEILNQKSAGQKSEQDIIKD
ncbi:DNA-binding transcriptional regulator, MarR family [Pedobacter suwonensis]|uniref:DNA-binding transcriptional regulator, MarR family n=1 Tax=Pedobacter suwonensis TaxID=332999 RepID=A0A1I0U1V4_9SPHI|nr:MarR family transcriptional regulator [Pedobacter suwonensis]SFA58032.1 DNA-binding transcriptional regulator, MarR family [Pedobacter suwonensis]